MAKKRESKSWYLHTIDDRPAAFFPEPGGGGCLCFIGRATRRSALVPDLATIRRQQALSWKSYGRDGIEVGRYDYVRFPRKGA